MIFLFQLGDFEVNLPLVFRGVFIDHPPGTLKNNLLMDGNGETTIS